ncbi:hypothetical protein CH252_30995 [Rhodococcus sp. 06-1477-1B]|nr:hypothetical protein CH252_30995 [Rhodococcus sp. 06-1477-1B]
MKKLKIDLTNCHGIHDIHTEIHFDNANAAAVYAPNGMMNTSFARTFGDLARNLLTADHLFPDRESTRVITEESGKDVDPEQVVVMVPYDEEVGPTAETPTLLVDKVLRDEHESLQRGIVEAKEEQSAVAASSAALARMNRRTGESGF